MFKLTDEAIDIGIDTISGDIVWRVALESGKSIEDVSESFLVSKTYALLSNKATGYYWDSIHELIDLFRAEIFSTNP
jgi:hypothetical protein